MSDNPNYYPYDIDNDIDEDGDAETITDPLREFPAHPSLRNKEREFPGSARSRKEIVEKGEKRERPRLHKMRRKV